MDNVASLISYPSGTVCQGFTSSSCQSSCPLWSAGASWAAGTVWGMYGISASAARAVGASTRTAVSRAPQRVRIFFRMFISFLSGRGRPSDLLCSVFMVQPSDRENKGDFVNDWKQKETSPPTEQNVRGGNQRYEEAASIQTAALFVLNSRPFTLPRGSPQKGRSGGRPFCA